MALSKITPESINLASDFAGMGFGGTGAANQLDDYEEGTWTPSVSGSMTGGTASYNSQAGNYVKVGSMVYASYNLAGTFSSAPSGQGQITGLPFTASNSVGADIPTAVTAVGRSSEVVYYHAFGSRTALFAGKLPLSQSGALTVANYNTHLSNSDFQLHGFIMYQTDS